MFERVDAYPVYLLIFLIHVWGLNVWHSQFGSVFHWPFMAFLSVSSLLFLCLRCSSSCLSWHSALPSLLDRPGRLEHWYQLWNRLFELAWNLNQVSKLHNSWEILRIQIKYGKNQEHWINRHLRDPVTYCSSLAGYSSWDWPSWESSNPIDQSWPSRTYKWTTSGQFPTITLW